MPALALRRHLYRVFVALEASDEWLLTLNGM